MIEGLLHPLRLPERALDAVFRIAEELSALRGEIATGLSALEERTASITAHLGPLRTDVAVVRESTSRLPEGLGSLEQTVGELGAKLDTLQQTIEGLKLTVEQVTKDLPGASGTGAIARVRDAIGRESG